VKGADNDKG